MKLAWLGVMGMLFSASYAANAEIVISGKPNNQYTQDSINAYEKNKALLESMKIDRTSFSAKVNKVCGEQVADISYREFHRLVKDLLGQDVTDEMLGLENVEMIKKTSINMCYMGAQEQISGLFNRSYAALLAEAKKREAAAVTMQDKAAASGFMITVNARKLGAEAAK